MQPNPQSLLADQVLSIFRTYLDARGLPFPEGDIGPDSELADFGFDSIDAMAMIVELENHFNLSLQRRQGAAIRQFSDLVALVAQAQQARPETE